MKGSRAGLMRSHPISLFVRVSSIPVQINPCHERTMSDPCQPLTTTGDVVNPQAGHAVMITFLGAWAPKVLMLFSGNTACRHVETLPSPTNMWLKAQSSRRESQTCTGVQGLSAKFRAAWNHPCVFRLSV